jgi:hypothetical protein
MRKPFRLYPLQTKAIQIVLVSALIFVLSFASYSSNLLRIANTEWFNSLNSQNLVVDGIRHFSESREAPPVMGSYQVTDIGTGLLKNNTNQGSPERDAAVFKPYLSQYGIQFRLFLFLRKNGLSIAQLQALTAAALSCVVTTSYLILRVNRFSFLASGAFAFTLAFSPWLTVFARNLYWIPFSWYLPGLITAYSGTFVFLFKSKLLNTLHEIAQFATLYGVLCFRFLSGYEYITTISVATMLTYLFIGAKRKYQWKHILIRVLAIFGTIVISFATSVAIHAAQLNKLGYPGIQYVIDTASKRGNPSKEFAHKFCNGDPQCLNDIGEASTKGYQYILARSLATPNILPWLNIDINKFPLEKRLQNLIPSQDIKKDASASMPMELFVDIINRISFAGILVLTILMAIKRRLFGIALSLSFLGSWSWFVLAKGHAGHWNLNYVNWYNIFLPVAMLSLFIFMEKRYSRR